MGAPNWVATRLTMRPRRDNDVTAGQEHANDHVEQGCDGRRDCVVQRVRAAGCRVKVWGGEIQAVNASFRIMPLETPRFWPSAR